MVILKRPERDKRNAIRNTFSEHPKQTTTNNSLCGLLVTDLSNPHTQYEYVIPAIKL